MATVIVNLRRRDGTAQKDLTNIKWAWFDQTDPNSFTAPAVTGTTETTNAQADIVVDVTGTSLTAGQFGCLALMSSDNVYTGIYRLEIK